MSEKKIWPLWYWDLTVGPFRDVRITMVQISASNVLKKYFSRIFRHECFEKGLFLCKYPINNAFWSYSVTLFNLQIVNLLQS
jgi:hypothetical protein